MSAYFSRRITLSIFVLNGKSCILVFGTLVVVSAIELLCSWSNENLSGRTRTDLSSSNLRLWLVSGCEWNASTRA